MKVLLTGASGFVGSHIAEALCSAAIPVTALVRPSSPRRFLSECLPSLEFRNGSITDPASLEPALDGITHVIHCAGLTRAVRTSEFFQVNQSGTRNLVSAINRVQGQVSRLVHISSLAAGGPGTKEEPANEADSPNPVSEYGRSKLAGEMEVRDRCRTEFVVLRPPAVYGPRDEGFLSLFKAVSRHVRPLPDANQALSLVYVKDLAQATVACLLNPKAVGQMFYVSSPEIVSGRTLSSEIARQMGAWTLPLPLPSWVFLPICLLQGTLARLTNRATLLSLAKYPELRAPAWVCNPAKLEAAIGFRCKTNLVEGVSRTLRWYRDQRWI